MLDLLLLIAPRFVPMFKAHLHRVKFKQIIKPMRIRDNKMTQIICRK